MLTLPALCNYGKTRLHKFRYEWTAKCAEYKMGEKWADDKMKNDMKLSEQFKGGFFLTKLGYLSLFKLR